MKKRTPKEIEKLITEMRNADLEVKTPDGKKFEIPESGSLGLLAIGYRGLMAWRKKKAELAKTKEKEEKN